MTDSKTLLIEAGIEEAPSWFIQGALAALPGIVSGLLEREKLSFQDCRVMMTPRRIALIVRGLAQRQPDETKEVTGPPAKIGVGPDGRFLPPAVKFAEKQGGSEKDLAVIETEKGAYVAVMVHRSGLPAAEIVARIVPEIFSEKTLPHQKSMRWGEGSGPFIRPFHWLVVLLGGGLVRCSLFGVESDRFSMGHRFHSPGKLVIESPESYEETLRGGRVVVDQEKRRNTIRGQLHEEAKAAGGVLLENPQLEEEVTNLVEWPVVIRGRFAEKFLDLPPEVIITVMARHQRYFAVKGLAEEKLLPCFLAVANTDPALREGAAGADSGKGAARGAMVKGYERVLTARLEDAGFFFAEDRKKKLEGRLEALKGIVFQRGGGDYYRKAMRLEKLAEHIARTVKIEMPRVQGGTGRGDISPHVDVCSRAARLCKADLASSMVFELPELQGVMGGIYARYDGEEDEVVRGISEHYLPASVSDPLPRYITGTVVSLADKIDSLMTFIALGHRPSSASDPLGFRRLCLGIIRLLAENENKLRPDLGALAKAALDQVREDIQPKDVKKKDEDPVDFLMGFIKDRLKVYWKDVARPDILDAALEVGVDDLVLTRKRLDALVGFQKAEAAFVDLAVAFKRAYRISRELEGKEKASVNPGLFRQDEERKLYAAIEEQEPLIMEAYATEDYTMVFARFSQLRLSIDMYFKEVFVNDENDAIKRNRLATLKMIVDLIVPAARLDLVQFERTKLPGLADTLDP